MENYLKGVINFKRENEFTNYFDSLKLKNLENNELSCDYCGCVREDFDLEEDVVCGKCGTLFEPNIDSSAEYRFFGAEDRSSTDPCRVGAPTDSRFPQSTLGTIILNKTVGGNRSNRIGMARVRRFHTWNLLPYKERSLLQVFEQLSLTATNNGIDGRTIDIAKNLYIRLVEHCDKRGMSRTSVVASCIYSALKMTGMPRKPKEISDIFHLSSTQFTKSFKYFQEVLSMANQRGLLNDVIIPANMSSTKAADYISQPLSKLPVSRNSFMILKENAIRVSNEAERLEICPENMPPSLAAGVIAFVLQHTETSYPDIGIERIASVCDISEGTLNKCLKKLETKYEQLKKVMVFEKKESL
jgi:transcription initiation factor TFIIIB Brf1 subunit/transcription initiation factor TFIIB